MPDLLLLFQDPVDLGVTLLLSLLGVGLVVWGRRRERTPQVLAGVILAIAPWLIAAVGAKLGFAGGVLATLWIVGRLER